MKLHNKILLGLGAGVCAGLLARALAPGADWVAWLVDNVTGPAGQVFLRLLLMTVVPLVFASLVLGIAGLGDLRGLGRMGGITLLVFLGSTVLSVVIGMLVFHAFRPGAGIDPATRDQLLASFRDQAEELQAGGGRAGVQVLVDIVPRNPIRAAADMQMLAVIFTAIFFGAALLRIPAAKAEPMLRFLDSLGAVVMKIIDMVLAVAPYGVFALIFTTTARFGWSLLAELGTYVGTVVCALLAHALLGISGIVLLLGRRRPVRFWYGVRASLVTAFSTSSSNATLPTSLAVAERELRISPRVAGFVLPLGATLNMNGTALFEGVTVLFLAKVFGVHLDVGQQVLVVGMCVLTAVGTAGVPGGSLPLLMGVLASVGVPAEGIAVILGVDRLLDMSRTVLNVAGDLAAATVLERVAGVRPPPP